ncbi:MAG: transcription elongation factor GreA [Bacteroidales bacterium]
MSKVHYLTAEGLDKIKAELSHMVSVERPAISKAIAEARDKGDLSENAEYDAAREAQGLLELKISQMQNIVANARVIDESKINTEHVQMLNKVKIKNLNNNSVMEYTLVGESEANLREGKLAAATPIGKALIGKKKGDIFEVNVPNGIIKFEILDISI